MERSTLNVGYTISGTPDWCTGWIKWGKWRRQLRTVFTSLSFLMTDKRWRCASPCHLALPPHCEPKQSLLQMVNQHKKYDQFNIQHLHARFVKDKGYRKIRRRKREKEYLLRVPISSWDLQSHDLITLQQVSVSTSELGEEGDAEMGLVIVGWSGIAS